MTNPPIDRDFELRRLRRHLSVQEHAVRAAETALKKRRGPGVTASWREKAEIRLREAVAGRDGFKKMIEELEADQS